MPQTSTAYAQLGQGSLHSFAALSQFLSEGAAHEETRPLREHLATLSGHIEQATQARRVHQDADAIERQLALLARCAQEHQRLLTSMDSAWHALYEFGAYQRALRELRDALARWRQALWPVRAPGLAHPGRGAAGDGHLRAPGRQPSAGPVHSAAAFPHAPAGTPAQLAGGPRPVAPGQRRPMLQRRKPATLVRMHSRGASYFYFWFSILGG